MPPAFLTPERKKTFWKKLIRKKIQKNLIENNNNKIIRAWYLREAPGEHTYLPKKTGIFRLKIVKVRIFLYYTNKTRGDIFEEKGICVQFC